MESIVNVLELRAVDRKIVKCRYKYCMKYSEIPKLGQWPNAGGDYTNLCTDQFETCTSGHTPGIWPTLLSREGGIWRTAMYLGWGIWPQHQRGGEFDSLPRFYVSFRIAHKRVCPQTLKQLPDHSVIIGEPIFNVADVTFLFVTSGKTLEVRVSNWSVHYCTVDRKIVTCGYKYDKIPKLEQWPNTLGASIELQKLHYFLFLQ